jgi:predicted small lipoprotein YifL
MMKRIITLLMVLALICSVTACTFGPLGSTSTMKTPGTTDSLPASSSIALDGLVTASYNDEDEDSDYDDSEISCISLAGDSISIDGAGAVVDGKQIANTSAGIYSISGTLNDGQIIVLTKDQETVKQAMDRFLSNRKVVEKSCCII